MGSIASLSILAILCMVSYVHTLPSEPMCSKFDYEMKTMEAMLRTEQKVLNMMQEMKVMHDSFSKNLNEMKELKVKITSDFDALVKTIDGRVSDQFSQMSGDMDLVTKKANDKMQEIDGRVSDQFSQMSGDMDLVTKKANDKMQEIDGSLQKITHKDFNVAFSVTNPTTSLVNGVPTFSRTVTNVGGAYKMDTGVFTSPIDGLYMFVFSVASYGKQDVYCYIKHNGDNKVRGRTNSDNSATTASMSVFLILSKGDSVSLGSCVGWTRVYADYSTTFSGALIKQTSNM